MGDGFSVGLSFCHWSHKLQVSCEADKLSKGLGTLRSWPVLLSAEVTNSKWQKSGYLTLDMKRKHTMTLGDTEWQDGSHIYTCSVCGWIWDIFLSFYKVFKQMARPMLTLIPLMEESSWDWIRHPRCHLVDWLLFSLLQQWTWQKQLEEGRKELFVLWFEEIQSLKRKPL